MENNNQTKRFMPYLVWFIAALFYAYQYILRVLPSVLADDIITRFSMDGAVFGQFSGVYYITYALLHMPIGVMLDRYGPRHVISACAAMCGLSLIPMICSDAWLYPIVGRALLGAGSSAAILGVFKVIRMVFPEQRFTSMLSLAVTIGLLGAIYGGGPVNYLYATFGYNALIKGLIVFAFLMAAFVYIGMPKNNASDVDHQNGSVLRDIITVLGNSKVVLICVFAGLFVGPLEGFADAWATSFLKKIYAFNAEAATLPTFIFFGMCFGAPILGFLAEKTQRYFQLIIVSGLVMLFVFVLLILEQFTSFTMAVGFAFTGVACAYQILAIYKASTFVPKSVMGLTTAVANMIIMLFGYIFHSAIGFVVQFNGGVNDANAFKMGLTVIPVALLIGMFGFLWVSISTKQR